MATDHGKAPYRLVEVLWWDANRNDAWHPMDDIAGPELAHTVGYLVANCPKYITLAQTWGLKQDGETEEVGGSWAVPLGMIERITYLDRIETPDA